MRPAIDSTRRQRAEGCVSDLALDRMVAGEASTRPDAATIGAHLAQCTVCAARLVQLRAEQAREAPAAPDFARRLERRRVRRGFTALTQLVLVAAALLLLVLPRWRRGNVEREKGLRPPVALDIVVRHRDGNIAELSPGGRVQPGDAIRFRVSTTRAGHLVILGLDAAGKVSLYVAAGAEARPIEGGSDQVMPGSIVLDETLGPERVVAVVCEQRFAAASAVDAGLRQLERAERDPRRVGALGLSGCHETAVMMEKSDRR